MRVVPGPVANTAALAVGQALSQLNPRGRAMAERHMERVLASTSPSVTPDPQVVRRWARRTFRAYARYWEDGARLASTDVSVVVRRMVVESGLEHLVRTMAAGKGVVLALAHLGSWEWGGAFLASAGYPMTSVAERLEPPELFDWFLAQREAIGLRIVSLGGDPGPVLLRTLREGGLVGLLGDRDIGGGGVEVEMFGERTTLPAGPAAMALRTGAALLVAAVYSGPRELHTGVVSPPVPTERTGRLRQDVVRVTQAVAHQFEWLIRRAPEQWHLFQPNWPSDPGYGT